MQTSYSQVNDDATLHSDQIELREDFDVDDTADEPQIKQKLYFGMTKYQILVITAAWWGLCFDLFDALLFNYISPQVITDLLDLPPDSPKSKSEISFWNATITSILLIGWSCGGILFGKLTDIFGRTKIMIVTLTIYSIGTALCGLSMNIGSLILFRFLTALGLGGEWGAASSLVYETVPHKRVLAACLIHTAAPGGLFLATLVTWLVTSAIAVTASRPELGWRVVFFVGLLPVLVAVGIRLNLKESEEWLQKKNKDANGSLFMRFKDHFKSMSVLFSPRLRRSTIGGLCVVIVSLLTYWCCTSFIPITADHLASLDASAENLAKTRANYVAIATTMFNIGGLLGTFAVIPIADLGRRKMYLIFFSSGSLAIFFSFSPLIPFSPYHRLFAMILVGFTIFGLFSTFPFYLPELYPTEHRGLGIGFCYTVGRLVTAFGPFAIGAITRQEGFDPLMILQFVAVFPLIGCIFVLLKVPLETKDGLWDEEDRVYDKFNVSTTE